MGTVLKRLYQPKFMVKDKLKKGAMPSTKEGYSLAFSIAWAAILETFLFSLIGMADVFMVSALGEASIAAVSLVLQPFYLAQVPIAALNIAITSICARRKGEGNQQGAINTLKQGLVLSVILSVIITAVFIPLARPMIRLMGAQPDTIGLAHQYLVISIWGMPLTNLSRVISAAQRGIGETKSSMRINTATNIIDLIFNYLLIHGIWIFPRMGVAGAAIATVIGWAVGLAVGVYNIARRESYLYVFERDGWKLTKNNLSAIMQVSSGSFIEQVCIRLGFILVARVVNGLGTVMLAAHEIFIQLMSLSFSFGEGFGIAASSLVGQNMGAGRPDLSIVYGKICQRMSLISSSVMFVVFALLGQPLVRLFTDHPDIISISRIILFIMGFVIFGQASQMVFMGSLRGAGDTRYTAIVSLISIMIIRPTLSYILAYPLGFSLIGCWIAMGIDQMLRLVLTYVRFSSGDWMDIKL